MEPCLFHPKSNSSWGLGCGRFCSKKKILLSTISQIQTRDSTPVLQLTAKNTAKPYSQFLISYSGFSSDHISLLPCPKSEGTVCRWSALQSLARWHPKFYLLKRRREKVSYGSQLFFSFRRCSESMGPVLINTVTQTQKGLNHSEKILAAFDSAIAPALEKVHTGGSVTALG